MRIRGLAGTFRFERGGAGDYRALARYHYAAGRPATWAGVWVVWHELRGRRRRAGVVVLSWPTLNLACRAWQPGVGGSRWLNERVRTISRVVVHPLYRGLGLGAKLVKLACGRSRVPVVEAVAAMGEFHPLFLKGGMRRAGRSRSGKAYFVWTRKWA